MNDLYYKQLIVIHGEQPYSDMFQHRQQFIGLMELNDQVIEVKPWLN
jgi:hypothetical protein